MILFLNFAPLSFGGGAELWMLDMAKELRAKEKVSLLEVDDTIGNLYAKLVLKRSFDKRHALGVDTALNQIDLKSLVPFTSRWREIRKQIAEARIIYTKYELNELLLLLYFGGSSAVSKTVIGTHSPLLYEHDGLTFFEKLHNFIYLSPVGIGLLSKAKLVHVLNDSQEKLLKKYGLKNVQLIPNYIKTQTDKPLKRKAGPLRIGYLGELSWRKGFDVLLEVIKKSSSAFTFEIMGDGPGKQAILDLNKPNVVYHGFIPHKKVSNILKELDVLLLPSRAESFSLASLEAMANGVIVLSSATSTPESMNDIVKINTTNSSEIYMQILTKYNNLKTDNKLLEMSQRVWKITNERFSKEKLVSQLLEKIFIT